MKKSILAFILFSALAILSSSAQSTIENSLLWKIQGNGMEGPSYLYGTIHIMCGDDFNIKDKVKKALHETENLVLEADFADPEELQFMQKNAMSEKPLSDVLTKKQYKKLDAIVKEKMNTGLETYNQFSLATLYSLVMIQSIDCPVKKMWEMELIALANKKEIDVHGLEKFEEQMDCFSKGFSDKELIKQILQMDEYVGVFDKMVELYNDEKVEELLTFISDDRFMNEETEYWLLEHRNKNWQKTMVNMMNDGSHFFAVGAAHLVGEVGMINLLRAKGYDVSPVF